MIIYHGIITLDYNPATDVLATEMPDVKQFELAEVGYCLGIIFDSIRLYDIKRLLLDSSKSVIEADDEAYKAVVRNFTMALIGTHLEKIARVATADPGREGKSAKVSAELSQELNLPTEYRNFTTRAEALEWLVLEGG